MPEKKAAWVRRMFDHLLMFPRSVTIWMWHKSRILLRSLILQVIYRYSDCVLLLSRLLVPGSDTLSVVSPHPSKHLFGLFPPTACITKHMTSPLLFSLTKLSQKSILFRYAVSNTFVWMMYAAVRRRQAHNARMDGAWGGVSAHADKASRGKTPGIRFPLKIKFGLRVKCAKLPDGPVSCRSESFSYIEGTEV